MNNDTQFDTSAKGGLTPEMISPVLAIELGYNIYLADANELDTQMCQSARAAVARLERILDLFDPSSKGGLYCLCLRFAANSLARGIARRKRILADKEKDLDEDHQQEIKEIADGEQVQGILKVAFNLVVSGGLVYYLQNLVFKLFDLHFEVNGPQQHDVRMLMISVAAASALIFAACKAKMSRRARSKMYERFAAARAEANKEYATEVRREYKEAASLARLAYKQMTQVNPPLTEAFMLLLCDSALAELPPPPMKQAA